MAIQSAAGWILDVSKDSTSNEIVISIKLYDSKIIRFKQRLQEHVFYILPKSNSAGQDLIQQLSKYDQFVKRIFWDEKFIDLQDKTKTSLIGISLTTDRQDFNKLVQKLARDSRVKVLYNIDLDEVIQFIYTLKISPTSKVRIEYDDNIGRLLSITKVDDSQELSPPPFSILYIEVLGEAVIGQENDALKVAVSTNEQVTTFAINGLSDPGFISYISQNDTDIVILCGNYQLLYSLNNKLFLEYLRQRVVIHTHNTINNIHLVELVEKARFGYLPLKFASRYGMIRLIDSRITYELLQRGFLIPTRMRAISKHHEQIRTLENIVEMDKAGMIISPEIGLHENVAVLDFNNEYANLIVRHNISYETTTHGPESPKFQHRASSDNQLALLPSIIGQIVTQRMYLSKQLNEKLEPNSFLSNCSKIRLDTLKQILVCLYGTSGSIWNRFSNVYVFEEINKLARQILLKTKDIVQSSGFELIYADTDAVFLKKRDATRSDYENIMNMLIGETGLDMTLEFHYKFLVLLYIEADDKMEPRKHYYGITYDNHLITRGIETRRHDSPVFIKEFQRTLLSKLFDCDNFEVVLSKGYQNALQHITHSIDKLMNGEIQITDLVISKLLRQNIEKYRSLWPHVAAAVKLNISGVITSRGENINYVYTGSNHADPLQRITPAKLMSSENYDKEKYLDMLFDSAEAVLSVFGFNRSLFGYDRKKTNQWWTEIYQQHKRDIESAKSEL
jgi:DNA polymerase elongation subunit (family B)